MWIMSWCENNIDNFEGHFLRSRNGLFFLHCGHVNVNQECTICDPFLNDFDWLIFSISGCVEWEILIHSNFSNTSYMLKRISYRYIFNKFLFATWTPKTLWVFLTKNIMNVCLLCAKRNEGKKSSKIYFNPKMPKSPLRTIFEFG